MKDCSKKGPVSEAFIEKVLESGKGASMDVVERLVGMVQRGDKGLKPSQPKPPKKEMKVEEEPKPAKKKPSMAERVFKKD